MQGTLWLVLMTKALAGLVFFVVAARILMAIDQLTTTLA